MNTPRSLHVGISTIGREVAKTCILRNHSTPSGAVDINPQLIGKSLADLVPGAAPDAIVYGSLDEAFAAGHWDVALLCTCSTVPAIRPDLDKLIAAGIDVISTCEELSNPRVQYPAVSEQLHAAAREAGVTVVGTGVNPGFALDLLPALLTRPCVEVRHVRCARVVNTLLRRKQLQLKLGAGLELAEFAALKDEGKIGHVGLLESAALVARALGWPAQLQQTGHTLEPIVAREPVASEHVSVQPGQVLGAEETITLSPGPGKSVQLRLRMSLGEPQQYDEVRVDGVPPLVARIEGGIHGDSASAGCTAGIIAPVMKAPAGLLTVLDLPIATA